MIDHDANAAFNLARFVDREYTGDVNPARGGVSGAANMTRLTVWSGAMGLRPIDPVSPRPASSWRRWSRRLTSPPSPATAVATSPATRLANQPWPHRVVKTST